jgi:GNAT superfamily N-acetyltransferase
VRAGEDGGGAIEIRRVRRGDERRLRELRLRALSDAPAAFASTVDQDAALSESHWAGLAAESDRAQVAVVFAAVRDERWLGLAAGRWFDPERGVVQLWGMWVDPRARGLRVGGRLVAEVDRWAQSHGARHLRLGVVEEAAVEAFYERLGFTRTGETRPLVRDESLIAIFLSRPVAAPDQDSD